MKIKQWFLLLMTLALFLVLVGYRRLDAWQTDTQAPRIQIPEEGTIEYSLKESRTALLEGVKAVDDRDGNVTDTLVVENIRLVDESGILEVAYSAMDRSNNVAKLTCEVLCSDYERPRFSLDQPLLYFENYRFDILENIHAEDILDGDIQHRIRATMQSGGTITDAGVHWVLFQVTNNLGDTVQLELPVEVVAGAGFNADLQLSKYLIYLPVGADFNPTHYLSSFTCKGETVSLEDRIPKNYTLQTTGEVDTETAGVYVVNYTMSYVIRNETNSEYDQAYNGYSKLVVVVEG